MCQRPYAHSPVGQGWTTYSETIRQQSLFHSCICRTCTQSTAKWGSKVLMDIHKILIWLFIVCKTLQVDKVICGTSFSLTWFILSSDNYTINVFFFLTRREKKKVAEICSFLVSLSCSSCFWLWVLLIFFFYCSSELPFIFQLTEIRGRWCWVRSFNCDSLVMAEFIVFCVWSPVLYLLLSCPGSCKLVIILISRASSASVLSRFYFNL